MNDKKTLVALYTRVSTAEQAEDGYSIGEQKNRLEKYAEAHGWIVYKLYSDPGISGGTLERPGLRELITDAKNKKFDKVVVYKLDRLSRSQKDTLYLIEDVFQVNNCDFVSMTENFDTGTPLGIAMIGILSVFAQLERAQIKERMNVGRSARAQEGKWHGGARLPIGYEYDATADKLVINDFEKIQIQELAERFLNGESFADIERLFKVKGYKHRFGYWIPKTMRAVLKNKVYCGYIRYNGEWFKGTHELIFTEEYYTQIENKMKRHDSNMAMYKDISHTTLLGGLIFCGNCGARYFKRSAGKNRYDYYTCYSRGPKKYMIKDPNCRNPNLRVDWLDDMIIGEIKKLQADPDKVKRMIEAEPPTATENNNAVIQSEIDKLDAQVSKLIDLYSLGSVPYETIDKKIQEVNSRREALSRQLVENDTPTDDKLSVRETEDIIKNIKTTLTDGTLEERRDIVKSLIKRIEIYEDSIKIYWRFI